MQHEQASFNRSHIDRGGELLGCDGDGVEFGDTPLLRYDDKSMKIVTVRRAKLRFDVVCRGGVHRSSN